MEDFRQRFQENLTKSCNLSDTIFDEAVVEAADIDVDNVADVVDEDAAAAPANEKLVLIKDVDSYSHIFPFMRQVHIMKTKFIIQIPDIFRWLDRTIHDIATVEIPRYGNCTINTNDDGKVRVDEVWKCLPNMTHRVLQSEGSPTSIVELNMKQRVFFLHHDWLVHDSSAALASLEKFLKLPEESLGRSFPAPPVSSDWHTDICSSSLYQSTFKPIVFEFYPKLQEIFEHQGHWLPDSISNKTAESGFACMTSCSSDARTALHRPACS